MLRKTPPFHPQKTPQKRAFRGMVSIRSATDYSPFGVQLENRNFLRTGLAEDYRYGGSNGQEKTDEIAGKGNHYTAEYWEYDSRSGRRWNIDPVIKYNESPYACFANNPIWFADPNGADTLNVQNTIKAAKFNTAVGSLNKSEKFRDFFQSFVSGKNSDVTLKFQAVNDLKTADKKFKLDGQVQLLYNGTNVADLTLLPTNASLDDFIILVELDSDIKDPVQGGDYVNARKGVTLAHEMFVHVTSALSMLRKSTNSDGTIDINSLQNKYLSTMEDDHNHLYSGKNKDFIDVANQVVAAQSNVISQYKQHLGSDLEEVQNGTKDLERQFGKMHVKKTGENYNAYFTYKQLWRFVFNDNMKPLPNIK